VADVPGLEPNLLHEFKNQLCVIHGFAGLALMKLPEGELRRHLVEIQAATTAALDLFPRLAEHYREK
jgi:hypothetical protein